MIVFSMLSVHPQDGTLVCTSDKVSLELSPLWLSLLEDKFFHSISQPLTTPLSATFRKINLDQITLHQHLESWQK